MTVRWVPRCTCARYCIRYIKIKPPILMSAERVNFFLNAPERFFCTYFLKNAKDKKALGVPKKEPAQCSYLSNLQPYPGASAYQGPWCIPYVSIHFDKEGCNQQWVAQFYYARCDKMDWAGGTGRNIGAEPLRAMEREGM